MAKPDLVTIQHGDSPEQTTTVTRRSFELLWEGKGWTIVEPEAPDVPDAPKPRPKRTTSTTPEA